MQDRPIAGRIAPEFFTRAGEPRQLPAEYVEAVLAATFGANCGLCVHSHFLIAPKAAATADTVAGGAPAVERQVAGAQVG